MVTLLVLYDNGYFIIIIRMLDLAYRLSGCKYLETIVSH